MPTEAYVFYLETPGGDLEVTGYFDVERSRYIVEPYSWGGSRGFDDDVEVSRIQYATMGDVTLTRELMVFLTSEDTMQRYEADATEYFSEMQEAA